jgi:predicted secreted hydrolase
MRIGLAKIITGFRELRRSGAGKTWARRILSLLSILAAAGFLLPTVGLQPGQVQTIKGDGWREAQPGYAYTFPRDYAAHPEYRIEWWYYTGNLETATGRQFGYQLTFFRTGIAPQPLNASRWAVRDLYMAHFCISDVQQKGFHSFERLNRAGIDWAGAASQGYRVWNEDWEARLDGRDHLLQASDGGSRVALRLAPEKAEVIHGEKGILQKGNYVGNAAHYYSLTRLRTTGQITVAGETFEVEGLSWMDREFGTSFLEAEQIGWDWFSIQLDDQRELMIYQFRRADGSLDAHSSGTLIEANGQALHLSLDEFTLQPAGATWRSEASGATYPVAWTITLPKLNLRLQASAAFEDQELRTEESTAVTYWEGSIRVEGTQGSQKINGRGYLEMTGYSGQNMGAMFH